MCICMCACVNVVVGVVVVAVGLCLGQPHTHMRSCSARLDVRDFDEEAHLAGKVRRPSESS